MRNFYLLTLALTALLSIIYATKMISGRLAFAKESPIPEDQAAETMLIGFDLVMVLPAIAAILLLIFRRNTHRKLSIIIAAWIGIILGSVAAYMLFAGDGALAGLGMIVFGMPVAIAASIAMLVFGFSPTKEG